MCARLALSLASHEYIPGCIYIAAQPSRARAAAASGALPRLRGRRPRCRRLQSSATPPPPPSPHRIDLRLSLFLVQVLHDVVLRLRLSRADVVISFYPFVLAAPPLPCLLPPLPPILLLKLSLRVFTGTLKRSCCRAKGVPPPLPLFNTASPFCRPPTRAWSHHHTTAAGPIWDIIRIIWLPANTL